MKTYRAMFVMFAAVCGVMVFSTDNSAEAKTEKEVVSVLPKASEPIQLSGQCGDDYYPCGGLSVNYTCCYRTQRCCAYTGSDNRTWYTCRESNQACP